MLVLSRKNGESIVMDGGITVQVIKVKGNCVSISIEAPREIQIRRGELTPKSREPALVGEAQ